MQLAAFSDDGVTVTIVDRDSGQEHSTNVTNFGQPQALPDIDNSLKVVDFDFVPGREYVIRVRYSNTFFTGDGDIDGVILFAFGGAAVALPTVVIDSIDKNFAPSVERMELRYSIKPAGTAVGAAKLEVFAAGNETPIFTDDTIPKTGTRVRYKQGDTFGWDGQGTSGWITPNDGPYKVKITVADDATFANPASAEKTTDVLVHSLTVDRFAKDGPHQHRFIMNSQVQVVPFQCDVLVKNKAGIGVGTGIPVRITWTFSDPAPQNTPYLDSFSYEPGKWLGKNGNPNAEYWEGIEGYPSGGNFLLSCFSTSKLVTNNGVPIGRALICFKPSAVGGDDFKLKASVLRGGQALKSDETNSYTVWRRIDYRTRLVEMHGVTHISASVTQAAVNQLFAGPNTAFVLVDITPAAGGGPTVWKFTIADSVPFIGLWDEGSPNNQKDWSALQLKRNRAVGTAVNYGPLTTSALPVNGDEAGNPPSEKIPAQERMNAEAGNAAARLSIRIRAQTWTERIDDEYLSSLSAWMTKDFLVVHPMFPNVDQTAQLSVVGSVVGIREFHPKFGTSALGITTEWRDSTTNAPYVWLDSVAERGKLTGLVPDQRWRGLLGFAYLPLGANHPVVVVSESSGAGRALFVTAHEIGHATKYYFKRAEFGPNSDHNPAPDDPPLGSPPNPNAEGLMRAIDRMDQKFSDYELKILRGIVP